MGPQKRKRLKHGERVTLSLMLAQVDLLTEDTTIGEHLLALLYAARVYDNVVRVRCTLGDLGQLSKYVADEADDTKDKIRQQRLDEIFEAIRTFEQSYYGASLRIVSTRPSAMRTGLEDP